MVLLITPAPITNASGANIGSKFVECLTKVPSVKEAVRQLLQGLN